jgi:hypothetical protein
MREEQCPAGDCTRMMDEEYKRSPASSTQIIFFYLPSTAIPNFVTHIEYWNTRQA